jgi:adhesin transport system outer membrane protein
MKMMNSICQLRRLCIAILTLVWMPFPVVAQTLQQAVEQTLGSNPDVLIEVERYLSFDAALDQARGSYLPRIDIALGRGKEDKDNVTTQATYGGPTGQRRSDRSLTLSQMLFDGFATSSEVDRNQARVDSASHKVSATSEQIALKAAEAYLEVLRQVEVAALTRDNLAVHQHTYDQVKLRSSSGVGRKSDLDQIEARLALTRSNLTAAEANLEVANINYKLVVGQLPGTLIRPKAPDESLLPATSDQAAISASNNNRLLKSAMADMAAADAQLQAARSAMYPRLDLEAGTTRSNFSTSVDATHDNTTYAMVKLRYTLFKGGSDVARIEETRHMAREAAEIKNRAGRQLEQSVRLSWNAYRSAHDRLPNLRQHAEFSQLTREAYNKQFTLGQRTLLDLLDTENEFYTANTNHINGQYVELFSRFRLLADLGLLLDAIGVKPPTESASGAP